MIGNGYMKFGYELSVKTKRAQNKWRKAFGEGIGKNNTTKKGAKNEKQQNSQAPKVRRHRKAKG